MATFEINSAISVGAINITGGEMAGILHLNPTPLTTGSGEAIVYSQSFNTDHTGITIVELPTPVSNSNGSLLITITGYSNEAEATGGGGWSLMIGGTTGSGVWSNYSAYFNGSPENSGPQTLTLLGKTGGYGIAIGSNTTDWHTQSLQIKVQSGNLTYDSTLQTPWTVTYSNLTIPAGWTSQISCPVRRSVAKSGDTMTGVLSMAGNRITSLGDGTLATDAVSKGQLDTKLNLSGGTLTGALTLSGDPTLALHATTKQYADNTFPTKTGTGASGTWGIAITGNSATATKLATARTISLTGDVTGSTSFDGSGNASITTAIGNDSHRHTGATVAGIMRRVDISYFNGFQAAAYTEYTCPSIAKSTDEMVVSIANTSGKTNWTWAVNHAADQLSFTITVRNQSGSAQTLGWFYCYLANTT